MAVSGYFSPFLTQVSVTTATTGQDLFTLLSAFFTSIPHKACMIIIQNDVSNGGATLSIGNTGQISSTNYGSQLAAAQAVPFGPFSSNLLVLDQVALLSSAGTIKANITVIVR